MTPALPERVAKSAQRLSAATGTSGARAASGTRSIDELDAEIRLVMRGLNAESYRLLVLVREFDDRLGWAKWSFPNGSEWLAWRCGLSVSAAREKLRTAHALRRLPAISKAFADGRLSYSKVRALTRVAGAGNEDLLLAYALEATAQQVEERCRQMRNVTPSSVDSARRAWERRALTMLRDQAAGTMTVSLELPIADGELIAKAVDRAVARGEAELGAEFEANSWRAQQADALLAVVRAYLGGGTAEGRGADEPGRRAATADHYQVVVHVDESALRGAGAGRSDLPIETVRRLCCDGSLIALVEDERGSPLAIGPRQRALPLPLRRAVFARDRHCTFPGCPRKQYVEPHHIRHWAVGGKHELRNLTLLCDLHHRLVHEGAFSIERDENNEIDFVRPGGRVIPRCGYRLEDVVDDERDESGERDEGHSVVAHHDGARNPSAEGFEPRDRFERRDRFEIDAVRETHGVYLYGRKVRRRSSKFGALRRSREWQ